MTKSELLAIANSALRDGFESVTSPWRSVCLIRPAQSFFDNSDDPSYAQADPGKYCRIARISPRDMASGEWKDAVFKVLGRGAAITFNNVLWEEAGRHGGPSTPEEAIALLCNGQLHERCKGLEIEVTFLGGQQWPRIVDIEVDADGYHSLTGSFDFGVCVSAGSLKT